MPIIGHVCKMAYGWAVGPQANTALALTAWEIAKATFQELAIPYAGMIVHHDRDAVYTGYGWTNQYYPQPDDGDCGTRGDVWSGSRTSQ